MGNTIDGFTDMIPEEQSVVGEPVTKKHTERGTISHSSESNDARNKLSNRVIHYGVSSMQGWRATMEDAHLIASSLTVPKFKEIGGKSKGTILNDHSLFAVFDGHGGTYTATYAGKHFLRILMSRIEWIRYISLSEKGRSEAPGIELLKAAMTGAFLDTDTELYKIHENRIKKFVAQEKKLRRKEELESKVLCREKSTSNDGNFIQTGDNESDPQLSKSFNDLLKKNKVYLDRSGSTVVSVLLTPTHIICANAGDSRALMCHSGKTLPLSFDHKPINSAELARVHAAGGFVKTRRINGDLAVSRGLGDFRYKLNDDLPRENQKVISKPDFVVCPRDDNKDEFLVLGCDGIWDVLDNKLCTQMIQNILDKGETDIGLLCEKMLDLCLELESKDNMTISIITLPSCRIMSTNLKSRTKERGKQTAKQRESSKKAREQKGRTRRMKYILKTENHLKTMTIQDDFCGKKKYERSMLA